MTFLITRTGIKFDLTKPTPEMVDPYDIAHSLSRIARFNGHTITDGIYTVAQHSCVCMWNCADRALWPYMLMHDAHEAYVGDISRGVGMLLGGVISLKDKIQRVIHERFGLMWRLTDEIAAAVKKMDDAALATELRDLMNYKRGELNPGKPIPRCLIKYCHPPLLMTQMFMGEMESLGLIQ